MDMKDFAMTAAGRNYIKSVNAGQKEFDIDQCLDYLQIMRELKSKTTNERWATKYDSEINAVKIILERIVQGKHD